MHTSFRMASAAALTTLVLSGCGGGQPKVTAAPFTPVATDRGWQQVGGPGGRHYSSLTQITPANVARLQVAWIYHTGDTGAHFDPQRNEGASHMAFEVTPIFYAGNLYFTTTDTNVVALDAATGKPRWRVDTHTDRQLWYSDAVSRGVSLWIDAQTSLADFCHARIIAITLDGRMLESDAMTGKPCADFGEHGVIDLTAGMIPHAHPHERNYLVTSPPTILDDNIIVGSSISDNDSINEGVGTVRAFDARTGKLVWSWDPIPQDASNPVYKEWLPAQAAKTGGGNVWSFISVDPERHLVYLPVTSADTDFFGGERLGDNCWADSLVTLDGDTGKQVWAYQIVHHDLWDYDLPAEPVLVNLIRNGKNIPAVIQPTKMGLLFTFNRVTGQPVFPIVEKPVPTDAVPGEVPSKTQPFPSVPAPLVRTGAVTPDDAWGLTFWDKGWCRKRIREYHSEGIYTPPSFQGTIEQPGYGGGAEWGGLAFDPRQQIAVINTNDVPMIVALIPRAQLQAVKDSGRYKGWDISDQLGTPYGLRRQAFLSPWGIPCVKPPWGELTAIDMQSGAVKWRIPFGNALLNHFNWGVPNNGGPVITAGGLIFVAATIDDDIRAFDLDSGKLLWQHKLAAGGQATPLTYAANGRQYVVIAAGGSGPLGTKRGDSVIAFALPQ